MKQLTDAERLEVAMSLLDDEQVDEYAARCAELEHQSKHNDFYNTSAECENLVCLECETPDEIKRVIDCPYVD